MVPEKRLTEQVGELLTERAQKALKLAKKTVLQGDIQFGPLNEALRYFIRDWLHASHPTLLSLTCEAVGGDPDSTTPTAAALVLIAGAADVHDDIIDQSTTKNSRSTVFGKFGLDITILLGDALLFKGLLMLHDACEPLIKYQKSAIIQLTKEAFFELGNAEAVEASYKRQLNLCPAKYQNLLRKKVAVSEAAAKIGAILGNGTLEQVESFGRYGRNLGFLMTLRDEFIDIFEAEELKNRFENECLPLPILNAFKDPRRKKRVLSLLKLKSLGEEETEKIVNLVVNAEENRKLRKEMQFLIEEETHNLGFAQKHEEVFALLLKSTVEDLPF